MTVVHWPDKCTKGVVVMKISCGAALSHCPRFMSGMSDDARFNNNYVSSDLTDIKGQLLPSRKLIYCRVIIAHAIGQS